MTLAKEMMSKALVAFVAFATVFALMAPAAQAQTTEELQQMINDLLAQVASLQAQLGQDGGGAVHRQVSAHTRGPATSVR